MATAPFAFGDLLLALLIFSDGQGSKKRPALGQKLGTLLPANLASVRQKLATVFQQVLPP
jgi:hypothetical protein